MPYKISGTKSETARVIILKESDWSIESNTVISGSGVYEFDNVNVGSKTILAIQSSNGQSDSYSNVDPVFYEVPGPKFFTWGSNSLGQLGLGDVATRSSPTQVGSSADASSMGAGGGNHSLFVKTDGTLWACGWNNGNQLGLGSSSPDKYSSPVQVGSDIDWSQVSTGYYHTVALKQNGTLWAWGSNGYGQLGLNSITSQSVPTLVGSGYSKVACGENHTIAIKTGGTLWSMGHNTRGQLGLGDNIHHSSPTQIGSDYSKIACGSYWSLAIKTNNTLWAFGANSRGEIGLGDNTHRSSPVQVGGTWSEISSDGAYHSVGIKSNGSLWAWGWNDYGQLGLGNIVNYSSPVQVGALTDWDKVECASYHSLAIKSNGTLWAWGTNSAGQLGDGTIVEKSSPVQVGFDTDWSQINGGSSFTIGIRG